MRRAKAAGNARRDAIVAAHMTLVRSIAIKVWQLLPPSFDLCDLVAEGDMALVKAAERYDPGAHDGTPFSAYARHSIRGAIIETCRRNKYVENTRQSIDDPGRGMVRLGYFTIDSQDGEDLKKYGSDAARALARMAVWPSAETSIDRARERRRIEEAMWLLPQAERVALRLIYDVDEPSLRDVARRMEIPLSTARALHASAIDHLRTILTGGSRERAELPEAA